MGNSNILSDRYASKEINHIFSLKNKYLLERKLWIAILEKQKDLGFSRIKQWKIEKYKKALNKINLKKIKEIELINKHDVKARIQHFNQEAGILPNQQIIHLGLTSRDITDNIDLIQIKEASNIIFKKYLAILYKLTQKVKEYKSVKMVARTHHVPAQLTTFGRRLAFYCEQLTIYLEDFFNLCKNLPFRGIKGPVGIQSEMLDILGSKEAVIEFDNDITKKFGFKKNLTATSQIYPRSFDYKLSVSLFLLASVCSNFAVTLRLMAGASLATEGFSKGQTGSSAMPHKQNTRSSERLDGLVKVIKSHTNAFADISIGQWEEGDVSCSALRRTIIPEIYYASDGVCETTLSILNKFDVFKAQLQKEVDENIEFLASSKLVVFFTKNGFGREQAHKMIKEYSNIILKAKREVKKTKKLSLMLANDKEVKKKNITQKKIEDIIEGQKTSLGLALEQADEVIKKSEQFITKNNSGKLYQGSEII